jgi:hypothetical protein
LKHFLLEINNVLGGNNEKIVNQTQEYLDSEKNQPTTIRDAERALELFNSVHGPINDKEKQAELYKDKNYFEVEFENKFEGGNSQQGEQAFNQLAGSVADRHKDFNFYQKTQQIHPTIPSEVVQEVKTSPQN